MIRLSTLLLTLAVLTGSAPTVIAAEPEGWCNCNPEAPACRSICPYYPPPRWGYHWDGHYWHHDYGHYRYRRHHWHYS
jgi:hypothetical protein